MAASVLFDAPGPKTRARHRLYGAISGIILAAMVAGIIWRFWEKGQFALRFWEPFVTPRIMNVLFTGLYQTLFAAVCAIIGALVVLFIYGALTKGSRGGAVER